MVAWRYHFARAGVTGAVKTAQDRAQRTYKLITVKIVDMSALNYGTMMYAPWNGTTSGVRVPKPAMHPIDPAGH